MASNFSHRPIFPSHTSEDNLVSPMRNANGCLVEGVPEIGGDALELCSKDIIDLLPSDPFLMDISTSFTQITGCIKDLQVNCEGYEIINKGHSGGKYSLLTGLNLTRDKVFLSNFHLDENDFYSDVTDEGVATQIEVPKELAKSACEGDDWVLHQALSYSLRFLGVQDLLSLGMVCKSLNSMVCSDPLLWRSIHINEALNKKIYDDVLLQLATRAQGNLQSLSLVECRMITDNGLREILEANPRLTKLYVPGCTRLSIEGIINNIKVFNSKNKPGIKHLRIGGLYDIRDKHFEELKLLLDVQCQKKKHKPHFYHKDNPYLSCDDDLAIDIETCPKCQILKLVYDCPSENCQKKNDACRACRICIPRCVVCGCCLTDVEYEENFLLDLRCSYCCKQEDEAVFNNSLCG